jgi:transposase-like protein
MNPQTQFCPNDACPARGKVGEGNILIHSRKESRYRCKGCGKTFSASKGTVLYGLKTGVEVVVLVITLLAHGCPLQAIVVAIGLDERTVRRWYTQAGNHCQQVHQQVVGRCERDLQQVQADEIKVKTQQGTVWMAMAMQVSTRLWLGGAVSPKRDKALITRLVGQIRRMALCRVLLVAVDGLSSYVQAFQSAFRSPCPTGKPGRPRLLPWWGVNLVQVVKRRTCDGLKVERRIVQGTAAAVEACLQVSQGGGVINTAFMERLNATFRAGLACLARRTRCLVRQVPTLEAGMFLVGCVYNLCTPHTSLRLPLWITQGRCRWVSRTPAIAAGLTDHRWSMQELLTFKVPPPPCVPPKQRGRPPKRVLEEASLDHVIL